MHSPLLENYLLPNFVTFFCITASKDVAQEITILTAKCLSSELPFLQSFNHKNEHGTSEGEMQDTRYTIASTGGMANGISSNAKKLYS